MHNFLHVGFAFPGVPRMRDLEPAFYATGDDWIRYSATSWIIWTEKPTHVLLLMLRTYLDPNDQVLIVPIHAGNAAGFLAPWIWEMDEQ